MYTCLNKILTTIRRTEASKKRELEQLEATQIPGHGVISSSSSAAVLAVPASAVRVTPPQPQTLNDSFFNEPE